jgi:hypothetical protein
MTETRATDRYGPVGPRPRGWFLPGLRGLVVLVIATATFTLGWTLGAAKIVQQYKQENEDLQKINHDLTDAAQQLKDKMDSLNRQLDTAHAQLAAVMGPVSTFSFNGNDSAVVSSGHFKIGLIGSPTGDGVKININGNQRSLVVGDVTKVDLSTTCRVEVTSFEMFKTAAVAVTCGETKPTAVTPAEVKP